MSQPLTPEPQLRAPRPLSLLSPHHGSATRTWQSLTPATAPQPSAPAQPPTSGRDTAPRSAPQQHTATGPHSSTCSRTSSRAMDTLPPPLRQGHMPRHRLRHEADTALALCTMGTCHPRPLYAQWTHTARAGPAGVAPEDCSACPLGRRCRSDGGTLRKATQHAAQGGPPGTPSEESRPACRLRREGWHAVRGGLTGMPSRGRPDGMPLERRFRSGSRAVGEDHQTCRPKRAA